jgi:hypothetical protein
MRAAVFCYEGFSPSCLQQAYHQAKARYRAWPLPASGASQKRPEAQGGLGLRIAGQAANRHGPAHECFRTICYPLAPWPRPPRKGRPPLGFLK